MLMHLHGRNINDAAALGKGLPIPRLESRGMTTQLSLALGSMPRFHARLTLHKRRAVHTGIDGKARVLSRLLVSAIAICAVLAMACGTSPDSQDTASTPVVGSPAQRTPEAGSTAAAGNG